LKSSDSFVFLRVRSPSSALDIDDVPPPIPDDGDVVLLLLPPPTTADPEEMICGSGTTPRRKM